MKSIAGGATNTDKEAWHLLVSNNKDLIPPNIDIKIKIKVCMKCWIQCVQIIQSKLSTAWFISWAGEFDKLQCCNCVKRWSGRLQGRWWLGSDRPQPLFRSILLKIIHRHYLQIAHTLNSNCTSFNYTRPMSCVGNNPDPLQLWSLGWSKQTVINNNCNKWALKDHNHMKYDANNPPKSRAATS